MSILLRNRITGITTSTDLFGEDLALFLREYPDLVKVGIGTTANQPYYILLNETIEEFRSPYANNGLSYNPSTGTLSAGVFSGNGSGLSNVTATGSGIEIKDDNVPVGTARTVNFANNLSVTFSSGIATVSGASSVSFATNAGIATYATSAGIATYASNAGIATYATSAGIATYATSSGIATYATSSGIATNVTTNANLTGHVTSVGNAAVLGSFTSAQLATALTDETGSGSAVFSTSPTLITPALGTPASGNLANCTGLPVSTGISGLGANVATFLATPSSANLISAVTDETGSGALVFATSPTLVTPALGTPASGNLTNCTDLNASQLSTGTVPTARLASGTANSSTYLRGDQTWQSISASSAEFASGTTIVFYQASAPTGWTKSTSHDNKALRVVSGTGGGSGGSSSFTSVFASRGVPLLEHNHSASSGNHDGHQHSGPTNSQSIDHNHSFTTGNQSANHTHTFTTNSVGDHQHIMNLYNSGNEAGGYGMNPAGGFENRVKVSVNGGDNTVGAGGHDHGGTTAGMSADHNHSGTTSGGGGSHSHDFTTQSGGSHNHSISVSNNGTASASMDFAVQYIDVIICSKN